MSVAPGTILSALIPRKLSKLERLADEQMLALLEGASDRPDKWHNIGKLEATQQAAETLAKRDVIELWAETNLYRLKKARSDASK